MLSDSWFRKWIPEFFFDPPVHKWWEKYLSGRKLHEDDKEFLSEHTEESYLALFPEYWFHGSRYKITVLDSLLTLRHYQKTGVWEYFHVERNPSLYFEYLENTPEQSLKLRYLSEYECLRKQKLEIEERMSILDGEISKIILLEDGK